MSRKQKQRTRRILGSLRWRWKGKGKREEGTEDTEKERIHRVTKEDLEEDEYGGTVGIIMECGPLVDALNGKIKERRKGLKRIYRRITNIIIGWKKEGWNYKSYIT